VYYQLLQAILQSKVKAQPLWVLEFPFINFSGVYAADQPSPTATVDGVAWLLEKGGYGCDTEGADFVGHSYGTVVLAWVIKLQPALVRRCLLIDPISVGLQRADLCYNFVYSPPRHGIGPVRCAFSTEIYPRGRH
jgi:pimeloyl-ACP methyl ester carboxylesterase